MGTISGSVLELSVGRAFVFGRFVPYVDMRLGVSLLEVPVEGSSRTVGEVTVPDATLVSPILGPRVGMLTGRQRRPSRRSRPSAVRRTGA
jgi:hypothetical protein